ncbi:hypothetical protein [Sphingobacterium pedocola]|uniref:Peptidoglycan-binding protein LysM n=1 Tax=Sphingobacterium pedocola TaxID=2082722 RepID=A0ABR9T9P6_9SPHI|nr:hypothetical protein [Sphingobacterium pedocola]MBE8722071.1 hypothetical protein [Sphingobacterium pedocola]
MKNNMLILVAVVAALVSTTDLANAQSRDVTVSVELKDVLSAGGIGDGGTAAGANAVDFLFDNVNKYNTTQTQTIADQVRVLSTKSYVVNLKAQTPTFVSTTSSATLPLDILKVSASKTGANAFGDVITPTTLDQLIVSQSVATLDQGYDFKYEIAPNQTLIEADKEKYNVVLTYTVSAQ